MFEVPLPSLKYRLPLLARGKNRKKKERMGPVMGGSTLGNCIGNKNHRREKKEGSSPNAHLIDVGGGYAFGGRRGGGKCLVAE